MRDYPYRFLEKYIFLTINIKFSDNSFLVVYFSLTLGFANGIIDFAYDNGTVKTFILRQTSELSGKKMKQLDPVYSETEVLKTTS